VYAPVIFIDNIDKKLNNTVKFLNKYCNYYTLMI